MRFEENIKRAVTRLAYKDTRTRKTPEEIENIALAVSNATMNSQYDFSNAQIIILRQNGNKRFAKQYNDLYSTESVLCQYIKQVLDKTFKIRYPNRNNMIRSLFNILSAVKQMTYFTIVKFDFKDYFNSVSSTYVFERLIKANLSDRFDIDLISTFCEKTKYTFAGLSTSNVIAEIIAKHFDEILKQNFVAKGKCILYFERYIDDGIIIFNEYINQTECENVLDASLNYVYHDKSSTVLPKCKTNFNVNKFAYISNDSLNSSCVSFDYLGYEFWFSRDQVDGKVDLKYGITKQKRIKYQKRLSKLLQPHVHDGGFIDVELLRHKIMAFSQRIVYRNKRYKADVWKVKGFISTYGELRNLLETKLIEKNTEIFLKTMVIKTFKQFQVPLPYFIKGCKNISGYSLFNNMRKNKTLLLVQHIGYDENALAKLCKQVGIDNEDSNGQKRGYGNLVKEYLIKMKVGH